MHTIRLKPRREKSLLRRHPWVYASAIQDITGSPGIGETVQVNSSAGEFLAWGAYSPFSQIRLRIWSWEQSETIDENFIRRRIDHSISLRKLLFDESLTTCVRLIHGESDGLPGLIVDRYGEILVVQFLSSGAEFWRNRIVETLAKSAGIRYVFERSDADVRSLEGLPERIGPLLGGEPLDDSIILENGLRFRVNIRSGHKTGFYLDQRTNRLKIRSYTAGRDVLDCFSYTGGFSLNALQGNARSVLAIDASAEALNLLAQNLQLNQFSTEKVNCVEGDVFQVLRSFRDQRRTFDMIILDPPKFAPTISQVERAARGYKDINLLALKLLRPGGILCTFSCSGGVSPELFQKIVAAAAIDSEVDAQIIEHFHQDIDHPIGINFPEGEYLKGLAIRKV